MVEISPCFCYDDAKNEEGARMDVAKQIVDQRVRRIIEENPDLELWLMYCPGTLTAIS